MNNRKPSELRNNCKDGLLFLDYLRKSRCTQIANGIFKDNYDRKKCEQTLETMEEAAKICGQQMFENEENSNKKFGR